MRRRLALVLAAWGVAFATGPIGAQTQGSLRLPLPIEGLVGALTFDHPGPPAAVLSGVLVPSQGPLISWAPVYSTLGADGALKDAGTGPWVGPTPTKWTKVTRAGMVVAGFRFLLRTAPAPVQTRQAQVFWRTWGSSRSGESSVFGERAGPQDEVRVIELRVPEGAVAAGLWGQTLDSSGATQPPVVQVSLAVNQNQSPAPSPLPAQSPPAGPRVVPTFREPEGPQEPLVPLLK